MKVNKENANMLTFVWSLIRKKKKTIIVNLSNYFNRQFIRITNYSHIVPFLINIISKNKINIENNSFSFLENLIPNNSNFLFASLLLIILFSLIFDFFLSTLITNGVL